MTRRLIMASLVIIFNKTMSVQVNLLIFTILVQVL